MVNRVILRTFLHILAIVFLFGVVALVGVAGLALVSWRNSECFIADQAIVLDIRDGLYLVYRVTGFHDKVAYFELYRGRPEFDRCGFRTTETLPVTTAFYQREDGLLKSVELHDNELEIIYTHDASEAIDPRQARLHHDAPLGHQ